MQPHPMNSEPNSLEAALLEVVATLELRQDLASEVSDALSYMLFFDSIEEEMRLGA
ncbi:MAG: hypothetical protein ABIJ09_24055 [Pseudomonadota bacterium]